MENLLIKWDELEWIGGARAKRKVVQTPDATFSFQEISNSLDEPKVDQHPEQQIVLLLNGASDFYVDDVLYKMEAGDMLVIPSNAKHYQRITSPNGIKNFLVFTPANNFAESAKVSEKKD